MEIKDYVKQFRDLQKSHKNVRVADFCRENRLDYYETVKALELTAREITPFDLITIVQRLMPIRKQPILTYCKKK